eukprot:3934049-Pleurochrysis_carterae.AAC.1
MLRRPHWRTGADTQGGGPPGDAGTARRSPDDGGRGTAGGRQPPMRVATPTGAGGYGHHPDGTRVPTQDAAQFVAA